MNEIGKLPLKKPGAQAYTYIINMRKREFTRSIDTWRN